ncbi:hypothetical protein GCM10020254_41860 [Streptomyces goshikiensis]
MARACGGAATRDRVVDQIQTCGDEIGDDLSLGILRVLLRPEVGDKVVEMDEELLGGQVDVRQRAYRGPKPPHGGGGTQTMAHHVSDDQGDPCARQRDHIEPVAAQPCPGPGREVAVGHLHGLLGGESLWQQASLQGQSGGSLAGEASGVVHGHGSACGDFLGKEQIVFVEGVLAAVADEYGHAKRDTAGPQRDDHDRMHPEVADLPCALGVGDLPALDGFVQGAVQRRPARIQAAGGGRGFRVVVHLARLDHRLGGCRGGWTPARRGAALRSRWRTAWARRRGTARPAGRR